MNPTETKNALAHASIGISEAIDLIETLLNVDDKSTLSVQTVKLMLSGAKEKCQSSQNLVTKVLVNQMKGQK